MPLHGRNAELARLLAAFELASAGQPQLLWIEGEPGSGKTRLTQAFYEALREKYDPAEGGAEHGYWPPLSSGDSLRPDSPASSTSAMPYFWWALRCSAGSEHNPESFQPYVDGIDELERHLAGMEAAKRRKRAGLTFAVEMGELLIGFLGPWKSFYTAAKAVKQLYEDLNSARPRPGHAMEMSAAREIAVRTEDVFLRLLAALNDSGNKELPTTPAIIVIDDAQWADARSIAFTRRVLHQAQEQGWRLLVLLTVRDTELAAQSSRSDSACLPAATLAELRADVVRVGGAAAVAQVALGPRLEAAAAQALLRDACGAAGRAINVESLQRLQRQAGDQPYYLLNYAQHVVEHGWLDDNGALTCSDAELAALPRDIDELLRQRLRILPAEQLEALQWGGVQGRRFLAELTGRVAAALGRNSAKTMLDLGRARDAHKLLADAPPLPPDSAARYEFAHRLLFEQVRAMTAPEAHSLAQRCLQELLAEHFDAGQLDELPLKERRRALGVLANATVPKNDQAGQLRAALVAGQLCRDYDTVQDYRTAETWALRLWAYAESQAQAGEQLSPAVLALLDTAFYVLKIRGSWEICLKLQELLLAQAREQGDDKLAAEALRNIGRMKEKSGELDHARRVYTEGLELAQRSGAEYTAAKIIGQLGGLLHYEGDLGGALELYNESLRELRRLDDRSNALRTLNNIALVYESQGEYDRALEIYNEILADRQDDDDELEAAQIKSNIGNVYFERGEYDRAFELYTDSLAALQKLGDESCIAGGLANVGAVHEQRGEYERALSLYEESLKICREIGTDYGAALTLTDMGSVTSAMGEPERAQQCWSEAAALYRACGLEADAEKVEARLAEAETAREQD